ncbi:hypothetical protein HanXRQr2_Chr10g0459961 [Helianthus annuus]|uniref:Uncharacterized protein n=1 Tax=Helianthus annuus TaxID=4232 RepID=A0A251TPW5_HELAN|nr:hypothetical protein HanXRQr2_Chr10g0459961 [Helianthus annuus]
MIHLNLHHSFLTLNLIYELASITGSLLLCTSSLGYGKFAAWSGMGSMTNDVQNPNNPF